MHSGGGGCLGEWHALGKCQAVRFAKISDIYTPLLTSLFRFRKALLLGNFSDDISGSIFVILISRN